MRENQKKMITEKQLNLLIDLGYERNLAINLNRSEASAIICRLLAMKSPLSNVPLPDKLKQQDKNENSFIKPIEKSLIDGNLDSIGLVLDEIEELIDSNFSIDELRKKSILTRKFVCSFKSKNDVLNIYQNGNMKEHVLSFFGKE